MNGLPLALIISFAALFLFSSFFSASETALTAITKVRLRQLRKSRNTRDRILVYLLDNPSRMLTTLLIGNNIVNIWATSIATAVAMAIAGPEGVPAATLIMTVAILVFGEIVPKTLAATHSEHFARGLSLPIVIIQKMLLPLVLLFSAINSFFLSIMHRIRPQTASRLTEEELKIMVDAGKMDGSLEDGEHHLLNRAFYFTDTRVREIMTPRTAITGISGEATVADAVSFFQKHQFSRIPVFQTSIDHILGMIHYKDILFRAETEPGTPLRTLARSMLYVPETQTTADLMGELRTSKQNIAIVIDEHGATAGLVTIDDAIASILGGIRDEYDTSIDRPIERVRILSPGHVRVPGNIKLDDINALLRLSLDSGYYETLGGFIMEQLGRLPVRNDSWESGNVRLRVIEVSGRTIHTVDVFLKNGDES